MRIRTVTAPNMSEGMKKLRRELGPNAIILSNHQGRGGVRITAAIDPEAAPAETMPAAPKPVAKPNGSKGPARKDRPNELDALVAHHRPPADLAAKLSRALRAFRTSSREQMMADALDTLYQFAPLVRPASQTLLLIGPPGAGKTVATAKLATQAVLEGRDVHVATTDTVKAGGVEQLEAFTTILNLPLCRVDSPAGLKRFVSRIEGAGGAPLMLIDTPGVNPFNASEIAEMRRYRDAAGGAAALVLPAGGDAEEAAEFARAFARLSVRQLIGTRLDMARRLGGLLAAADAGGLALSDVSVSPYVSDALIRLDAATLSRLLCGGADGLLTPSQQEFAKS